MVEYETIQKQLDRIEKNSILSAKKVLTLTDVATLTGLSRSYLYKLTCKHLIPYYKPTGRGLYFERGEVENWLLQNRVASETEIQAKAETIRRGYGKQ